MADGIKYNGHTFLLDNFDTAFVFGYPLSISNPNGIFLFKVASISNRHCKLGNSIFPFCGNLGFARLWLLNKFGAQIDGLQNTLRLMFIKLRIANDIEVASSGTSAARGQTYKYANLVGSFPYLCQVLLQRGTFDQEF